MRDKATKILEVGVRHGGSLKTWRDYFHNAELILGLDNGSESGMWTPDGGSTIRVEYADSHKPSTLVSVAKRFGPFDFICDDGDHTYAVQVATFAALRPYLKPGGIFVTEDVAWIGNAEEMAKIFKGEVFDRREVKQRHDDILVVFHG